MERASPGGRRNFVITAAGMSAAAVAAGFSACQGDSTSDRRLQFTSLAAAREELERLAQAKTLSSSTVWSWAQTLAHCAQSIEYSMSGFPQTKPELFQRTIGSAAFSVFSWRGRMTHDLAEPIPGAPLLDAQAEPGQALGRLRASMLAFLQWPGPLRPHFAYGELTMPEYELAHAMHLANHLSAYRASA